MKTLIIGASTNPERYSYKAAQALLNHNHEIVLLGNKTGEIFGHQIEKTPIAYTDIDTVTLYIGAPRQKDYYDYLLTLKPRRVIFNPGTENEELYPILQSHNIECEVACTLVLLSTGQF